MTWAEQRLGRIARLRVSNVDKLSRDGEAPVRLCNYVDVYKNDVITLDLDFMRATATPAQVANFRLRPGDTVFTKDSETAEDIGVPAYVGESTQDLVCGYHLAIASPDREQVDPRFLFWAMSSTLVREQWTTLASGVTRVGLRSDDIGRAAIPIPPLGEQRRIADFLDAETSRLDELDRLHELQLRATHERAQAVLDHAAEWLLARWGSRPLRRELERVEQGMSPQCLAVPADTEQFGVLKLSAVTRGRYVQTENKTLPSDVVPDRRFEVRAGDLLMSRANTPDRVGDVAVVHETRPGLLLPDLLYRLTLAPDSDADFVALALRTSRMRAELSVTARGTSQSMVKLRGEDIAMLQVPAAPEHARRSAVNSVRAASKLESELERLITMSRQRLAERRQALITAAVTGQIDVTTARKVSA